MKFSILICSIKTRAEFLRRITFQLADQMGPLARDTMVFMTEGDFSRHVSNSGEVEIIFSVDNGEKSIGQKRNQLLSVATGDYVAFVDDDDEVSPDYVRLILQAIANNPDCVGFRMKRMVDGVFDSYGIHTLRYEKYGDHVKDGVKIYERTPNHLNPIRRKIALQAGFAEKNWGEDSDYALSVYPLLKSECFIDRILYTYLYRRQAKRKGEIVNATTR